MTQIEKDLLLKDLSARLPYGVKCTTKLSCYPDVYLVEGIKDNIVIIDCPIYEEGDNEWEVDRIIPYLRSMSSMTKEEYEELRKIDGYYGIAPLSEINDWEPGYKSIDWLNKHHFDFRDLIPLGLALEALDGMY